jgi:integrase
LRARRDGAGAGAKYSPGSVTGSSPRCRTSRTSRRTGMPGFTSKRPSALTIAPGSFGRSIRARRGAIDHFRQLCRLARLRSPNTSPHKSRSISKPTRRKAWEAIESPVHRGYHLFCLLTGCRPGEGSRIKLNDIDTDARSLLSETRRLARTFIFRSHPKSPSLFRSSSKQK